MSASPLAAWPGRTPQNAALRHKQTCIVAAREHIE